MDTDFFATEGVEKLKEKFPLFLFFKGHGREDEVQENKESLILPPVPETCMFNDMISTTSSLVKRKED